MDGIVAIIKAAPVWAILGVIGMAFAFGLLLPLTLRLAGLTGQQIMDTLSLTMQFFLNLVREFREQNKTAP